MTPIEKLQPGMKLNSAVHDSSGRLLAKADTVLTEKQIKVLKTWGITGAYIKNGEETSEQQATPSPPSAAALEQAEEIASYLFSLANREHPAMQQLYDISVQRMASKLSSRGN